MNEDVNKNNDPETEPEQMNANTDSTDTDEKFVFSSSSSSDAALPQEQPAGGTAGEAAGDASVEFGSTQTKSETDVSPLVNPDAEGLVSQEEALAETAQPQVDTTSSSGAQTSSPMPGARPGTYGSVPKSHRPNRTVRTVLLVVAGLLLVFACGYGGAMLSLDHITDQVAASTEAQMEDYLSNSETAVLYRDVETADTASGGSASIDVSTVADLAADSVVEILTEVQINANWFGYSFPSTTEGAGSGVILSENGYILTCYHVIDGATSIAITLRNGDQYEATLVGGDEELDIAVLKIEADGLTPAVLGDSSELGVGSPVVAIGNPLGQLGGTVTAGYISALERDLNIDGHTYTLLQTDAAINGGNSGGGLFNSKGELIGLVNAKASSVGVEGLGFAIPIDDIKQDIEDVINYGYVTSKVALGVTLINIDDERTALSYQVDEMGVYILYVQENSNASYAGLQSGDRILSVDGEEIETADRVVEVIGTKSVGDTIDMTVVRNGEEMAFHITLYGVLPTDDESQATHTKL